MPPSLMEIGGLSTIALSINSYISLKESISNPKFTKGPFLN